MDYDLMEGETRAQFLRDIEPFERLTKLLSETAGAWQKPWPNLPFAVLVAMRSPGWGRKLMEWPEMVTLGEPQKRDISRIGLLLHGLARAPQGAIVLAPLNWVARHHMSRSKFFEAQKLKIAETQAEVLKVTTPDKTACRRLIQSELLEMQGTGTACSRSSL